MTPLKQNSRLFSLSYIYWYIWIYRDIRYSTLFVKTRMNASTSRHFMGAWCFFITPNAWKPWRKQEIHAEVLLFFKLSWTYGWKMTLFLDLANLHHPLGKYPLFAKMEHGCTLRSEWLGGRWGWCCTVGYHMAFYGANLHWLIFLTYPTAK